jgi:hypothetical protein
MVMTNRDRIDRGMTCLAAGLGPFVDTHMAAAFDGRDWVEALAARGPSGHEPGHRYSRSDPRFLLRVVTEHWRVFKDQLSRVEQGYATELRHAGNQWAHAEPFSAEDTHRSLDTMERLLTAVGAAEQAGQVRSLRRGLAPPDPPTAASCAGTDARRAPPGPGRLTGFWAPVRYEHVLRAIEEYDRLGQDRFLAQHGFGRAHGYLLTHGGRSYDSKAIVGVAYQHATGIRLRSSEFNGGRSGAAGVLGKLGFQITSTRTPAAPPRAAEPARPTIPARPQAFPGATADRAPQPPASSLEGIDPRTCLLVLTCSARKEPGGQPPGAADASAWPPELWQARRQILATAHADTSRVLPAWRRYTGTFYQHAQPALADAVAHGHVVIISGGYGIARAIEPIAWYDKILQLTDWPPSLLESALISEARRCHAQAVIAFAAASTDYARLIRRTPWSPAGIDARLVTITGITSGAISEVPRRLGQAFSAFWNDQHDNYPPGTTTETLP